MKTRLPAINGRRAFKTARKLINYGACVESRGESPLIPAPQNQPRPRGILIRRIGWAPGKGPKRGSVDWLLHKNEHRKEEARLLLKLIPRDFESERTFQLLPWRLA
jgi:hypothetical protein